MLKRVLIIHPEGNSYTNPTMKCIIDLLCDNGVGVHIMHKRTAAPMPPYRCVSYSSWGRYWAKLKNIALIKLSSQLLSSIIFMFEAALLPKRFNLIIGVDREGLLQASFYSLILKKPYIFFSYEIMFEEETSARFKRIERIASEGILKWFVQDSERASMLAKENDLDPARCVTLPLASKGIGKLPCNRLRDELGIRKDLKVGMIMGSLSDWSMSHDILKTIALWPEDWCLIVHYRYGQTKRYIQDTELDLAKYLGKNLFLSDSPVQMVDDMGYLLSGVSAGLAFYKAVFSDRFTGKNLEYLGLASGKISSFLRYGVPVVMNQIGMYALLAEEHGFAVCVDGLAELPCALKQIEKPEYSAAAKKFFSSQLDFSLYEHTVWCELENAALHT
jgi:hypothetical protein